MATQGDLTLSNDTPSRTGEVFWVSKTSSKNILTYYPFTHSLPLFPGFCLFVFICSLDLNAHWWDHKQILEPVNWGSWKVEEGTWTGGNTDWGTWDGWEILSLQKLLVLCKYLYILTISAVHTIIACFWCHTLHISDFDYVLQSSCILKGFSLFLKQSMSSDKQVSMWKPKMFSGGLKSPMENISMILTFFFVFN